MALAPSVSQLHLIFLLLLVFVCDSVDVFLECINAWEFWGCDHWPTPRYIAGGQLKDLYEQVYSQLKWNNNVDPKRVYK